MTSQSQILFQRLLGICMLSLVLLSALAVGANRPVWWSLLSICVFFGACFQFLPLAVPSTPKPARSLIPPALLFLGVLIWGWLQTTAVMPAQFAHPHWNLVPDAEGSVSADPGQGRHAAMRLATYGLVFCSTLLACANRTTAMIIVIMIALFSTAMAGLGILFMVTGNNPILGDLADPGIVKSTFVNRNNYATYAGFGMLANLAVAMHLSDKRSDSILDKIEGFFSSVWIFALGFAVCLSAVVMTQSRAGAMAAGVGLLMFLALRYSKGRWRGSLALLLIAAVFIFVLLTISTGLMRNYMVTSAEDARFLIFPAIVDAIMDRPLLGHGLGAFEDVFRAYLPATASDSEYLKAHNTYLELAFGLGIPATAAFLVAIAWVSVFIFRASIKRRIDRMLPCFALGCIAIAAIHSFMDFSLQIPAVAALFAAILGLGVAQSSYDKPSRVKSVKLSLKPDEVSGSTTEPQS